jgi:hypothetical protein
VILFGSVDEVWPLSGNATKLEPQIEAFGWGKEEGVPMGGRGKFLRDWRSHEDANCSGVVCLNLEFGGQIDMSFLFWNLSQ